MDPDQNLKDQLRLAARIIAASDKQRKPSPEDAYRLAELVEALNEWICKGGFPPKAWQHDEP